MTENWRPVSGHPGYEISDHGHIRSYRNRQGHPIAAPRLLSPGIVGGYRQIKLGRSYQAKIHTLVLDAFVGPRPDGTVCRHLDGNPMNNRLSNLRWGTLEENYADRHLHGTHNTGSRNGRAKANEQMVMAIRERLAAGEKHSLIAEHFGVSEGIVRHISSGHTWNSVPVRSST